MRTARHLHHQWFPTSRLGVPLLSKLNCGGICLGGASVIFWRRKAKMNRLESYTECHV